MQRRETDAVQGLGRRVARGQHPSSGVRGLAQPDDPPALAPTGTQRTEGLPRRWQVSARSDGDLKVQESLDGYYIRNWSLWLDLYVLARTFLIVIKGTGAY